MDMDSRKIGEFLRTLRKEKGVTQEQLAEILLVSGRTVSRWETGSNIPDLGILIQMAEFYNVDIKEIIDGERKGEIMDKELKETLSKVANYSKMEKEKVAKARNIGFVTIFATCAMMIVIQLIITNNLLSVIGETIALLLGGITYIGIMVYNGVWATGTGVKSSPFKDGLISVVCSTIFSVVLVLCYIRLGAKTVRIIQIAILFFVGITVLSFVTLRLLNYFNCKRKEKKSMLSNPSLVEEVQPVHIYIADGNMQADMIIEALRNNNIMAYKQNTGDAGFASVRYGMGRGLNDSVKIFISNENADEALKIIKELGLN